MLVSFYFEIRTRGNCLLVQRDSNSEIVYEI